MDDELRQLKSELDTLLEQAAEQLPSHMTFGEFASLRGRIRDLKRRINELEDTSHHPS